VARSTGFSGSTAGPCTRPGTIGQSGAMAIYRTVLRATRRYDSTVICFPGVGRIQGAGSVECAAVYLCPSECRIVGFVDGKADFDFLGCHMGK